MKIFILIFRFSGVLVIPWLGLSAAFGQNITNYTRHQSYIQENKGQVNSSALYVATTSAGVAFFYKDSIVVQRIICKNKLKGLSPAQRSDFKEKHFNRTDTLSVISETFTFPGQNPNVKLIHGNADGSHSNYFIGNDPSKWVRKLVNYKELIYKNLYPGVDYKISCHGMSLMGSVEGMNSNNAANTKFANNPLLLSSSYIGGIGHDEIEAIDVDEVGNMYLCGRTWAANFPVTPQAYDTIFQGNYDGVVLKFDSTGSNLIFSSFLGGNSGNHLYNIHVKPLTHEVFVSGGTSSLNFPTTPASFMPVFGGGYNDGVIVCLNNMGDSLIYSTFIGGTQNDQLYETVLDPAGNVYVSGSTNGSFPVTPGSYQPNYGGGAHDMFLCKLNPSGSSLVFSTYVGGPDREAGANLAVDSAGNAYLGCLSYGDSPVTPGVLQPNIGTDEAWYICKISPAGNVMLFGTYFGSNTDNEYFMTDMAVDKGGVVCLGLAGIGPVYNLSPGVFTNGPYPYGGYPGPPALFKLSPQGDSLRFSTIIYNGGNAFWTLGSNLILNKNRIYYVQQVYPPNPWWSPLPATLCAFDSQIPVPPYAANIKSTIIVLTEDASKLLYLSYFGGSKQTRVPGLVIKNDIAYLAGSTNCFDLPFTVGAYDTIPSPGTAGSIMEGFFSRIKIEIFPKASFNMPAQVCKDRPLIFQNTSRCSSSFLWKFGDGNTSTMTSPSHTYHAAGTYTVTLIASNEAGTDTLYKTITVQYFFLQPKDTICEGDSVFLAGAYRHSAGIYTDSLTTSIGCDSIIQTSLFVSPVPVISLPSDTVFCEGESVQLDAGNPGSDYQWSNGMTSQVISVADPGQYYLTVSIVPGCEKTTTINVHEMPLPTSTLVSKTALCPGDEIILATDTCPGCHYLWNTGASQSSLTVSQTGFYTLHIYNEYCSLWDTTEVEECVKIRMPNVFTPNGDGYNDKFLPEYTNVERYTLTVFNRWGALIYTIQDFTIGWDGTMNNTPCPVGTYFYLVEYEGPGSGGAMKKEQLQGTFSLLR